MLTGSPPPISKTELWKLATVMEMEMGNDEGQRVLKTPENLACVRTMSLQSLGRQGLVFIIGLPQGQALGLMLVLHEGLLNLTVWLDR